MLDLMLDIFLRSGLHRRWLLAIEALAAQGTPVWKEYTDGLALCSFSNDSRPTKKTSRTAMIGQAGNAMHCEVCGIIILFAITQVQKKRPEGLTQNSSLGHLVAKLTASFD